MPERETTPTLPEMAMLPGISMMMPSETVTRFGVPQPIFLDGQTSIPTGLVGGMEFSPDGSKLAITLNTPKTPSDSFVLVTGEGERLTFDTTGLEFRSEFPAPHLAEHRVIGDQIVVTYKSDGDRLVVTQLDDKGH